MNYKHGKYSRNNSYFCKCGKKLSSGKHLQCSVCYLETLKGETHPSYKKGKPKCIDCGIQLINYSAKRCRKHANLKSIKKRMKSRRSYKGKNHPLYGKHHSKETKRKMREHHANVKGKNNPMFGKVTHSKYNKYKGMWFHSSWESKFARFLDVRKIKWLYESKTFDLGEMTYTPDFYLPETDTYIEIKGYWRPDAEKKFKIFKKKYKNIKIKIINYNKLKLLKII